MDQRNSNGGDIRRFLFLGVLCMVYGGFIALLALIPNPMLGRVSFIFCAGVIALVGILLYRSIKKEVESD